MRKISSTMKISLKQYNLLSQPISAAQTEANESEISKQLKEVPRIDIYQVPENCEILCK